MTEHELVDRLREAIVLDGLDAWRKSGFLQEAQGAGLSLESALKLVSNINLEINNNSLLFQNIRARINQMAEPSRGHLISQDLRQIVNAAQALNLSPEFVQNTWVPSILAQGQLQQKPDTLISNEVTEATLRWSNLSAQ